MRKVITFVYWYVELTFKFINITKNVLVMIN